MFGRLKPVPSNFWDCCFNFKRLPTFSHKSGKSINIPNPKTIPPENHHQTLSGTLIRRTLAFKNNVNKKIETNNDRIMIIGRTNDFLSAAPDIITGNKGKTQGDRTVKNPAKTASKLNFISIMFYIILA